MSPLHLIKYITWYATAHGILLTTNRLVKFLYLADLYSARATGATITNYPWAFVYYGPYCSEASELIDTATRNSEICKNSYQNNFGGDKEFHIYSCRDKESEAIENQLHISIASPLQWAIRKFGDDTPQLLDYVYFETEPMKNARAGDLLQFPQKIEPQKNTDVIKRPQLSIKKKRRISALLTKMAERQEAEQSNLGKDSDKTKKYLNDSYYSFIDFLDGEDIETGMGGDATIGDWS